MKKQSSAFRNISVVVSVTLVGFLLYAVWNVVILIACAALAAIVATPAIDRLRTTGIGSWQPNYLESLLSVAAGALAFFLLVSALPPPSTIVDAVSSLSLRSIAGGLQNSLSPAHLKSVSRETVNTLVASGLGVWLFAAAFAFVAWVAISNGWSARAVARLPWPTGQESGKARLPESARAGWGACRDWLASGGGSSAIVIGAASWLVFQLVGLRHADTLALLVGGGALLPFPGLLAAIIFTAVSAAFDSVFTLITVLTFFGFYSWVEEQYLQPRLGSVDLSVGTALGAVAAGLVVGLKYGAVSGTAAALLAGVLIRLTQAREVERVETPEQAPTRRVLGEVTALVVEMTSAIGRALAVGTTPAMPQTWRVRVPTTVVRGVVRALAALLIFHALRVPNEFLLALLIGLSSTVPVVGLPGALVVCAVVTGADSTLKLVGVLAFFVTFYQIEKALKSQTRPAEIAHANGAVATLPLEVDVIPALPADARNRPITRDRPIVIH